MRALVLVNPNASRAEAAMPWLAYWAAHDPRVSLMEVSSAKAMADAIEVHADNADRIVLGGGDGTLSSMLPSLLPLGKPLAVLPLGTANDFARTLSIPENLQHAAALTLGGREHRIDVGMVNGHPFLNVASVGVASTVSEMQNEDLKKQWSVLSYGISFREAIRRATPFHVHLKFDGDVTWRGMVYQVSVGNGRFHGGGLVVGENAAIDDGKLNVYAVRPGTALQLVACLATLRLGLAGELRTLKRGFAQDVVIATAHPRPINVDGDIRTETPAHFSIHPRALSVVIPERLPLLQRGLVNLQETGT
ncbi:lipid kinase [Methyloligella sp. 2.7D]|uniref:lipid kinase n=1 Tax=unclassified Methyloligella TaxID=2625955 RepID=UPI00157CBCEA|nr:lipid kinase [Methyloligella sp. GL2]QKP77758.1 lipid kinase [Methyloligella sp. GL2]